LKPSWTADGHSALEQLAVLLCVPDQLGIQRLWIIILPGHFWSLPVGLAEAEALLASLEPGERAAVLAALDKKRRRVVKAARLQQAQVRRGSSSLRCQILSIFYYLVAAELLGPAHWGC